jgi:hypothetical protein
MKGLFGGLLILIGLLNQVNGNPDLLKPRTAVAVMMKRCGKMVAEMTANEHRQCKLGTDLLGGSMYGSMLSVKCMCAKSMFMVASLGKIVAFGPRPLLPM